MERRIERRLLRDVQNPFELPNREFLAAYRLNKELLMDLTDMLRPHFPLRGNGLAPEITVLVAVEFFANRSYQRPAGNQCEFALSQSTSRCVRKVAWLINRYLLRMDKISNDTTRENCCTKQICKCSLTISWCHWCYRLHLY